MTRRVLRVNELLRDELSFLLQRKVHDPRLQRLVTITRVSVSKDLSRAKVFVSVMGSEEEKVQVFQGLKAASPFLRRNLGPRLSLRHIPQLSFQRDDSLEEGARVLELMNRVASSSQDDQTLEER
ncbi:MAG: 30S ribosome-binding factor RbfA [Dehalococcoidia bacterium]